MTGTIVGIEKVSNIRNNQEINNVIIDLLNQMKNKGEINIPKQACIFIKPNICIVKGHETGATVDPFVVKCLVDWLLSNYNIKRIVIGEADATELNINIAFKVLGWEDTFKNYPRVQLLNITTDDNVDVNINGIYFKDLKLSKEYMNADYFISVAKLKTHLLTGITGILKNQFGANPIKYKAQYHAKLNEVIHDLNKARMPDLCIIDGIIALEGSGPVNGIPKPLGLLMVGNDAVATDCVCAKIIGFNPKKNIHINLAIKSKLGSSKYETFGMDLGAIQEKFVFVPVWKRVAMSVYKNKLIAKIPVWKSVLFLLFRG